MEKYDNVSLDNMSRTKRNKTIYNSNDMSNLSRIKTNTNVSIISDAPKEIDLEKIKNYVYSLNDENEEKKKRISLELPEEEEVVVERKEIKNYDINTVLEKAKDNRESDYGEDRYRKINNTQIDILKNIKIKDEVIEPYVDEDLTAPIDELNTEEKTIVDLIKDIQSHGKKKDLFEDLMAEDDETTILSPIEEEEKNSLKDVLVDITQNLESIKIPENDFTHEINLEKEAIKNGLLKVKDEEDNTFTKDNTLTEDVPKIKEIDKSFYSTSMSFNKKDFEGFDDIEKGVKKNSALTKLAIIFVVILLIATILLILNFIFGWNII